MKRGNLYVTIGCLVVILMGAAFNGDLIHTSTWDTLGVAKEVLASQGPGHQPPLDEKEPNNSRSQSNTVPPGTPYIRGSISSPQDADYFSFSADQGDRLFVSVDTSPSMTGRDSMIRVFFGNRVIASDDDNGPNPKGSGLAAVSLPSRGRYFVEVRGGTDTQTISAYHLFLCALIGPTRPESEPDDSIETTTIASNVNGGVIRLPGDNDIWQFPAKEKDTVFFGINQTGETTGFDAVLELRDPGGNLLVIQDNNRSEPGNAEFISVLALPETGMYSVWVREARILEGNDRYDYLLGICLNGYPLRRPPVADAGPDKTTFEREPVVLEGSRSQDPNGDMLFFEWVQLSGPFVEFDRSAPDGVLVAPEVDMFQVAEMDFELRIANSFGLTDQDRVTVLVSDQFQLRDDRLPARVLFNLASMEYFWIMASHPTYSGSMTMQQFENSVLFRNVPDDNPFGAKVDFDERVGGAELTVGGMTYNIYDSNFDNSQGPRP